jgi:hypothetical protein
MVCVDQDSMQGIVNQVSNIAAAVNGSPVNGDTGVINGSSMFGSNGLLSVLNCSPGTDCYKSRHHNALFKKLNAKKKIYANAPIELSRAEKNLYVFNKGETGGNDIYNNLIIGRFAQTAGQFKQNSIDKQQQFMASIIQSIKQYQSGIVFMNQMKNLVDLRQAEQDDLIKKINYYQTVLHTSERKFVYENKNKDNLYSYQRIMIFLYYAGLICFIIFGNFIPDKLYLKSSVWLIVIIVAIIPLILNLFIMWIFLLYDTVAYWFSELPHKDIAGGLPPTPPLGG